MGFREYSLKFLLFSSDGRVLYSFKIKAYLKPCTSDLSINQDYTAVDRLSCQQVFTCTTDSVQSTGKTNGITPMDKLFDVSPVPVCTHSYSVISS